MMFTAEQAYLAGRLDVNEAQTRLHDRCLADPTLDRNVVFKEEIDRLYHLHVLRGELEAR
jgi:hypothetical protein